jgi:AAA-like domain
VGGYLLKELDSPLVLAMDEVESIFETEFRSDFFGMLRSWHNSRATRPVWKQLDLALVTSTEPYQLIENLNQSPFNVGQVIELMDFDAEQVADLNRRHRAPLDTDMERQLMALLDGHPYLVRRALYLIASERISVADLFAKATDDRGPFGDHLRYHLFRLHDKPDLIQGLLQVLRHGTCQDERIFFRLRGAGLVRREGRAVLPRCRLYGDYFQEHLHG